MLCQHEVSWTSVLKAQHQARNDSLSGIVKTPALRIDSLHLSTVSNVSSLPLPTHLNYSSKVSLLSKSVQYLPTESTSSEEHN